MKILLPIATAALFLIPPTVHGDEVDRYAEAQLKQQKLAGLSLAVVRRGRVIKSKGYGVANLEWDIPVTAKTVYPLASVTKQFTAAAVLLLVEDGRLRLTDRIGQHLNQVPAAWSNITVRNLLTMTSGLNDYLDRLPESQWGAEFTCDRIIESIAALPLDFPPGEEFRYSNSNYVLLAMLVQKISGQSYDRFLEQRVFKPLGMTAIRRETPGALIPQRAACYEREGDKLVNARFLNPSLWNNGDGGLMATVEDLSKWAEALMNGGVLSPASREEMWTPVQLNKGKSEPYGFGWNIGLERGHRWVAHSGGRPGMSAHVLLFPDDRFSVVVLMNSPGDARRVAMEVAGLYLLR